MSDRRNRPPNKWGCKPTEDVCVEHDFPLECKHGCWKAKPHKCVWLECNTYTPAVPKEKRDAK